MASVTAVEDEGFSEIDPASKVVPVVMLQKELIEYIRFGVRHLLLPAPSQPYISLAGRSAGRRIRPDDENGLVEVRIMTKLYRIFDI